MLELLDGILTVVFVYSMPLLVGLGGAAAAVLSIAALVAGDGPWQKLEGFGACGTAAACCSGFFVWLSQFEAISDGEPVVDVTLALFIMLLTLETARAVRALGIPWVVICLVAWCKACGGKPKKAFRWLLAAKKRPLTTSG